MLATNLSALDVELGTSVHDCPCCDCEAVEYAPVYGPITEAEHRRREITRAIYEPILRFALQPTFWFDRFVEGSDQDPEDVALDAVVVGP